MKIDSILETKLQSAVDLCGAEDSPPKLVKAIHHAVFPGGARIRPKLCLAVSEAIGCKDLTLAMASAVAIELLHCASLVHDDLPCFDNAEFRRGKPTVHKAFDERLAVLAGDALIVLAYQTVACCKTPFPERIPPLVQCVSSGVGAPRGIIAGQAWECENKAILKEYQRAKTGSLFVAATTSGAVSGGEGIEGWRELGETLGEAYQVADDIRDVIASPDELGKPSGQDEILGRMSSAKELGLSGAVDYFDHLINKAVSVIPPCHKDVYLKGLVKEESKRLVPKKGRIKIYRQEISKMNQKNSLISTS
ncbi:MAG: geranylgeranyl pyrophosphate synthase [Betaproteobacteria bacterium TMED82]|nr:MAG: geranylgeranyl pyrophosphate synthase [Betaproteobacteria bacterium TMED82]|tara:strand:- start:5041 stop:5961 length:921 start_codon:yes stop_codon:yes gene_type:complete